jgi:hypothetical protein
LLPQMPAPALRLPRSSRGRCTRGWRPMSAARRSSRCAPPRGPSCHHRHHNLTWRLQAANDDLPRTPTHPTPPRTPPQPPATPTLQTPWPWPAATTSFCRPRSWPCWRAVPPARATTTASPPPLTTLATASRGSCRPSWPQRARRQGTLRCAAGGWPRVAGADGARSAAPAPARRTFA